MMLSVTKIISDIGDKALKTMLRNGAFPEVHYEEYPGGASFYMFEFSNKWSKFMKILDTWIKQEKLDERLGVFTRKHSADFLAKVTRLASDITIEDVENQVLRFHTWCDDLY